MKQQTEITQFTGSQAREALVVINNMPEAVEDIPAVIAFEMGLNPVRAGHLFKYIIYSCMKFNTTKDPAPFVKHINKVYRVRVVFDDEHGEIKYIESSHK